jgi:hypothetical protein
MSAADQLVHVLACRAEWDDRSSLLWAADGALLIRDFGTVDWAAALEAAQAADAEVAVRAGLRHLREAYGLPIWGAA